MTTYDTPFFKRARAYDERARWMIDFQALSIISGYTVDFLKSMYKEHVYDCLRGDSDYDPMTFIGITLELDW